MFRSVFANNSVFNLHFMKVSTGSDNNFGYEKITIVVDFKVGCAKQNKMFSFHINVRYSILVDRQRAHK